MKCPVCGCLNFYVKDPEDEYETYVFSVREGSCSFTRTDGEPPMVDGQTQIHCDACTWNGCLDDIAGK